MILHITVKLCEIDISGFPVVFPYSTKYDHFFMFHAGLLQVCKIRGVAFFKVEGGRHFLNFSGNIVPGVPKKSII